MAKRLQPFALRQKRLRFVQNFHVSFYIWKFQQYAANFGLQLCLSEGFFIRDVLPFARTPRNCEF